MIVHFGGWKLLVAAGLAALIVASVLARAPRAWGRSSDPRKLVLASLALYALGTIGWVTGHLRTAAVLYGVGIGSAALGAWLSRVGDGGEGLRGPEPRDDSPGPGGHPPFDWDAFERELLDYTAARERQPAARR